MHDKPDRDRKKKEARTLPAREQKEFEAAMRKVGKRIRALRLERNLSQEAMDEFGDVLSVSTYQEIEAGRRNPTVVTLFLIARRLKVDLSDIFKGV